MGDNFGSFQPLGYNLGGYHFVSDRSSFGESDDNMTLVDVRPNNTCVKSWVYFKICQCINCASYFVLLLLFEKFLQSVSLLEKNFIK